MKANTITHRKFKKLKRMLGLSHWETIGLLESIWMLTASQFYQGNIGKLSNEELAEEIEWSGDADFLIQSLIECGWIFECDIHRLGINDWEDHCPKYVKANIAKYGRFAFSPKETPKGDSPNDTRLGTSLDDAPSKSSQVKPSLPPTPHQGDNAQVHAYLPPPDDPKYHWFRLRAGDTRLANLNWEGYRRIRGCHPKINESDAVDFALKELAGCPNEKFSNAQSYLNRIWGTAEIKAINKADEPFEGYQKPPTVAEMLGNDPRPMCDREGEQ